MYYIRVVCLWKLLLVLQIVLCEIFDMTVIVPAVLAQILAQVNTENFKMYTICWVQHLFFKQLVYFTIF